MAVEYICDGCGKRQPASINQYGDAFKPYSWFERVDEDGTQHACSRECIEAVAKKTGKTAVVLPVRPKFPPGVTSPERCPGVSAPSVRGARGH